MKKIKILLAAIIVTSLSVVSCSSDSDGNSTNGNIVAKWNPVKSTLKVGTQTVTQPYEENEPGCPKDYVNFLEAGTLANVIYFKNASDECTADAATQVNWVKDGTTLVITGGEYDGTYEITKLTSSELRIADESTSGGITTTATVYFSKAAE
ncbi:MAG TPA: hypothetical protein VK623_13165 [Flavobacterium sp.]|nr:hypothetical protein [Flavobacterium sp.]